MCHLTLRHSVIVAAHAIVGWALCAATMGLGIAATGLHSALIIHAVAAPIIFTDISALYFARFGYTRPLTTALAFVAIVVFFDATVVAMVLLRSFEMFTSFAGTWLPFGLIFGSTYITGIVVHPAGQRERATSLAGSSPSAKA